MNKVMAVILNYNSYEDCIKCVNLLKKQSYTELQIVIVDNNSTDGSAKKLLEYGRTNDVFVIDNKENRGFSAGNNIGLKKAKTEECKYAMVINPDVEIGDEDYVSKVIDVMDKDSQIAVLGTDIINTKKQHQNPMRELSFLEESFLFLELIKNKVSNNIPYVKKQKKSGYCDKVSGCCFFVDMDFIECINYLDENVFLYCEEPILAKTVQREGRKVYYLKECTAFHNHIDSKKGNQNKRMDEFLKSRLYYLDNYSGYKGLKLKIVKKSRVMQNHYSKR